MAIKLSIGTAVYNLEEAFLREHIEGILPQLSDEAELILIDDCSKNNSGEICKEYAEKNAGVRYVRLEENSGLSVVRNRTITEARGEWIFFADGDDLFSEHFVQTALGFLDTDAEIIIHERLKFLTQKQSETPCSVKELTFLPEGIGRKLSVSCMCLDTGYAAESGLSNRAFYHAAWGAFYKKEFLIKNELIFPAGQKKAQDAVFNTEVYNKAQKIAYLPYIMYYYRGNPQGITRRYSADLPEIYRKLLDLLDNDRKRFYADDEGVLRSFKGNRIISIVVDNMRLNFFHKDNPLPKSERKQAFLSFIEQEPYRSAIEEFDPAQNDRWEWLLTINLIRKKRFATLDLFAGDDIFFNILSGAYKRFAKKKYSITK